MLPCSDILSAEAVENLGVVILIALCLLLLRLSELRLRLFDLEVKLAVESCRLRRTTSSSVIL